MLVSLDERRLERELLEDLAAERDRLAEAGALLGGVGLLLELEGAALLGLESELDRDREGRGGVDLE